MPRVIPSSVIELRVIIPPHNTEVCIGLYEKEVDVLRAMRLIRNNNHSTHYQFVQTIINNPKLVDISLKSKVY